VVAQLRLKTGFFAGDPDGPRPLDRGSGQKPYEKVRAIHLVGLIELQKLDLPIAVHGRLYASTFSGMDAGRSDKFLFLFQEECYAES
jgi:hypothetical protein